VTAIRGGDEGAIANGAAVRPFRGAFQFAPSDHERDLLVDFRLEHVDGRVREPLLPSTRAALLELAQELHPVALRWAH
jgi:hypothetical protein